MTIPNVSESPWKMGTTNYQCELCPFSSLELGSMEYHQQAVHAPAETPVPTFEEWPSVIDKDANFFPVSIDHLPEQAAVEVAPAPVVQSAAPAPVVAATAAESSAPATDQPAPQE